MRSSVAAREATRDEASVGYQWLRRPRRLLALLDGLAATAALLCLLAMSSWRPMPVEGVRTAQIGIALVLLLTIVLGFRNGQYTNSRRLSRVSDAGKLATHLLVAICVVALLAIATKGFFYGSMEFSRLIVGASLCIFFILAALCRFTLAMRQRALFMQGKAFRRVLVLGERSGRRRFHPLPDQAAVVGRRLRREARVPSAGRSHPRGLAGRAARELHRGQLQGLREPRPALGSLRRKRGGSRAGPRG